MRIKRNNSIIRNNRSHKISPICLYNRTNCRQFGHLNNILTACGWVLRAMFHNKAINRECYSKIQLQQAATISKFLIWVITAIPSMAMRPCRTMRYPNRLNWANSSQPHLSTTRRPTLKIWISQDRVLALGMWNNWPVSNNLRLHGRSCKWWTFKTWH